MLREHAHQSKKVMLVNVQQVRLALRPRCEDAQKVLLLRNKPNINTKLVVLDYLDLPEIRVLHVVFERHVIVVQAVCAPLQNEVHRVRVSKSLEIFGN